MIPRLRCRHGFAASRYAAVLSLLLAVASGCGTATPLSCLPGAQQACACPGGGQGVQVCNPDGHSLGACQACEAADMAFIDLIAGAGDLPGPGDMAAQADAGALAGDAAPLQDGALANDSASDELAMDGAKCSKPSDCKSAVCDAVKMTCTPTSCSNGVLDPNETDIDCGGGTCAGCRSGQACWASIDCESHVCRAPLGEGKGSCASPTAIFTLCIVLVGRSADTMANLPAKIFGAPIHAVGAGLARIVPNLQVYVPARALLRGQIPGTPVWSFVATGAMHALFYATLLLTLSALIFRKRDFQ